MPILLRRAACPLQGAIRPVIRLVITQERLALARIAGLDTPNGDYMQNDSARRPEAIEVADLHKSFGTHKVLKGVSLRACDSSFSTR